MLAALTRLRQICCDPRLRGLNQLGSGKLAVLMETLQPLMESGHKVLVFSQFVEMLKLIEQELNAIKAPYYMLTGKTTQRQELVEAFEADERPVVFLISLKAGGTGLNLTSASHVILFDPWWNPAAEAQAIDRTHRIGQDKTVLAFRLVSVNTIEDRILELQERKRDLVKNILEAESFNRSLTREDFDFLLQET
jgi:SNF2 family DNA or RNA helicase